MSVSYTNRTLHSLVLFYKPNTIYIFFFFCYCFPFHVLCINVITIINLYPTVGGFPVFRIYYMGICIKHISMEIFSEFRPSISIRSSIFKKFNELNFPVLPNFRSQKTVLPLYSSCILLRDMYNYTIAMCILPARERWEQQIMCYVLCVQGQA